MFQDSSAPRGPGICLLLLQCLDGTRPGTSRSTSLPPPSNLRSSGKLQRQLLGCPLGEEKWEDPQHLLKMQKQRGDGS